jgi:tRNA (cytidine/uridine-2'-O-)-methyltransferase
MSKNAIDKYDTLHFNVVLVEPQIPNNTGNIGRLCVGSKSRLHLISPLGFEITDARVKRAGLDYWNDLEVAYHDNFEAWLATVEDTSRVFFFTSNTDRSLYKQALQQGDWLVFGRESDGLNAEIQKRFEQQLVTIPFPGKVRSFNLANAVAMTLGEGLRQLSIASS